jgi:glycerol-1-phosphate dehydrogenase [NAD(P)+]
MKKDFQKIAIPQILEVGTHKMDHVADYICKTDFKKIVVFYGQGIKELFGPLFLGSFEKNQCVKIIEEYVFDDINMSELMKVAFTIPNGTQAIVGVGGGKVLDVAKYIAFLNNLFFISIPTSTAHDGFASSGCSLIIEGKRTSLSAKMPYGIIVDLNIVKNSPEKFIFSGLGDIVSKITAVQDWKFEESHGYTKVHDFAVMMAKKSVNSVVRMPYTSIKEEFFLKEIVDSLTMSGIAMEIAGNSSPASGSEHLISHALDKIIKTPELHGIQVGIATLLMSFVQEHRSERVVKFLTDTGFIEFVQTLNLKRTDFEKAIEMAPEIKPNRYTFIHLLENREKAKKMLSENDLLRKILQ